MAAVEVDQLVVGDVAEVAIDGGIGSDADEDRLVGLDLEPNLAEDLLGGPVELVWAKIDVLRGDRIGGTAKRLAIGVEVAVVAPEGVRGQHGDPAQQQRQADQSADAGK